MRWERCPVGHRSTSRENRVGALPTSGVRGQRRRARGRRSVAEVERGTATSGFDATSPNGHGGHHRAPEHGDRRDSSARPARTARTSWPTWRTRRDRTRRLTRPSRTCWPCGQDGSGWCQRDSGATRFDRTQRPSRLGWPHRIAWRYWPFGTTRPGEHRTAMSGWLYGWPAHPQRAGWSGHDVCLRSDMNHPLAVADSTCHDQPRVEARPRRSPSCP
jgi:hypothetical protein